MNWAKKMAGPLICDMVASPENESWTESDFIIVFDPLV
jgi:hypothetical protein